MVRAVIFDYGAVLRRRLRLQPALYDFARRLREEGYETAVLSNMYAPLTFLVKQLGDTADFNPVVFSSDIGVRKPSPKAYQAVLQKLGFRPEDCLFVDNRSDNVEAAQQIGMATVLAKNTEQTIDDIKKILSIQ